MKKVASIPFVDSKGSRQVYLKTCNAYKQKANIDEIILYASGAKFRAITGNTKPADDCFLAYKIIDIKIAVHL